MRSEAAAFAILLLAAAAFPVAAAAEAPPEPTVGHGFFDAALPILVEGDSITRANDAILLARGGGAPFRLTLTAESLVVERSYARMVSVDHPLSSRDNLFDYYEWDERESRDEFGVASVSLVRAGEQSTAFLHARGADAYSLEASDVPNAGILTAQPSSRFRSEDADVETRGDAVVGGDDPVEFGLDYAYDVPHFLFDAPGATFRAVGNFSLFVWDADFVVAPADGNTATYRTGQHADDPGSPVREEEVGNAVLRVVNGVLTVEAPARGVVASPGLDVLVDGNVVLPNAVGGFSDGTTRYEATGLPTSLEGDLLYSFSLLSDSTDRALVSVSGSLASITLEPVRTMDRATFLGTPAAQAAAVTGGVVVLAASTLLLARRGDLGALRARPRARVGPDEDAAQSAVLALERGDEALALRLFDRAVKERPEDVVLLVDYGAALEGAGRLGEARDCFERAVRLDPTRAESHYYYSRVLLALGLTSSALPHLQRALLLDPRLREMARDDRGFRGFADHPSFLSLVG